MNKRNTIILAILGGFDIVMSIFMPIAVALLWIVTFNVEGYSFYILLVIASLASLFKGLKVWIK